MQNLKYFLLAILLMLLPLMNSLLTHISDIIQSTMAVVLLYYAYFTFKLYETTHDSNRILSFSGLFVDKEEVEKENIIKIENNTNRSVLNVYIISFLIDSTYKPEKLYSEIQPFIHPEHPIVQSDILKNFRTDLGLEEKFTEFTRSPGYHLVIGLLTPQMKEDKEVMIFYFENKNTDLSNLEFEHRHYNNKQEIYKSSFGYIWKEYKKYEKKEGSVWTYWYGGTKEEQ